MTTTKLDASTAAELGKQALAVWNKTGGPERWPSAVRVMSVAEHDGEMLAWPTLEGEECADIIRLRDGAVLDEEALPGEIALRIQWAEWRVTQ